MDLWLSNILLLWYQQNDHSISMLVDPSHSSIKVIEVEVLKVNEFLSDNMMFSLQLKI